MKYCPECGYKNKRKYPVCPVCGRVLATPVYGVDGKIRFAKPNWFIRLLRKIGLCRDRTQPTVRELREMKMKGRPLVGQTLVFGARAQGRGTLARGIIWRVLAEEDDRVLVISRYGLEEGKYHRPAGDVTWEKSAVRHYLNNEFLQTTFTEAERGHIPAVENVTEGNFLYGTVGGDATCDRVFLLSREEALRYFPDEASRMAVPTERAMMSGVLSDPVRGSCRWWLRTPGKTQSSVCSVGYEGRIYSVGNYVDYSVFAVRPAMWIYL